MSEIALCAALRQTVALTRDALVAGAVVDLAGLDREVATLCAAVPSIPEAARAVVAAELKALFADLDRLAGELTAHEALLHAGEIEEARRRAAGAYAPPPAGTD